jgi:hypothetical protein
MVRGRGQQPPKKLKDTEVARLKRQAEALRGNLRKRKDRDRARDGVETPVDVGSGENSDA